MRVSGNSLGVLRALRPTERGAGTVEQVQVVQAEGADAAISPVGDFIALVGGFAAALFAVALKWYTPSGAALRQDSALKALRGINPHNPVGVICFVLGVSVFAFAILVLVGRFVNPQFKLIRSPGWIYGFAASVIFMAAIVGLVVPPNIGGFQSGINAGLILELMAAAAIGVGGLLKF